MTDVVGQVRDVPGTRRDGVRDTIHGVEVVDPFRWLEGEGGRPTEEVTAWVEAQRRYGAQALELMPGRAELERRIKELERGPAAGPALVAGPYYFRPMEKGLMVRRGPDGEERLLVDPRQGTKAGEHATISGVVPSPDGEWVACAITRGGAATCHLVAVKTGEWLPDELPDEVNSVRWLPDGRRFIYNQAADRENIWARRIKLHVVGRHHSHDPVLFEAPTERRGAFATISRDGRWLILGEESSDRRVALWVVDFARYERTGELERTPIHAADDPCSCTVHDDYQQPRILGNTLYLFSTLGAPRGQVFAVDLTRPAREHWRLLIAERPDAVMQDVAMTRSLLVVRYLRNAHTTIERFHFDGTPVGELPLPGVGSGYLRVSDDRDEMLLWFTGFTQPWSISRVDAVTGRTEVWRGQREDLRTSELECRQVWYPSRDGTPVSMFLVHRRGLALDGDNPTLLHAYGGFGWSLTPRFEAFRFPWYEGGGVFAVPNLRGGGEYGEEWARLGRREHKANTIDDFVAAAEWLVGNGYTRPERLGITGGCAGGVVVLGAATQRPELFRAVIAEAVLADMFRFQLFRPPFSMLDEFGTVEDPAMFEALRRYSPYHQVKDGAAYPAMLFTTTEQDPVADPVHTRKMLAAVQAATSSDPVDRPVLLRLDATKGHMLGKPAAVRAKQKLEEMLFAMWQLGMSPPVAPPQGGAG